MTDQMQELLTLVSVDRVSMTRDRSSLRVYIISPRLIDKRNIWSLEKEIREQLFPGKQIQIHIFEKYTLSEQYTPEKLLTALPGQLTGRIKGIQHCRVFHFPKRNVHLPEAGSSAYDGGGYHGEPGQGWGVKARAGEGFP